MSVYGTTVVNVKKTPDFDVYIGRPSEFGNPFVIGKDGDRDTVIEKFKQYVFKEKPVLILRARTKLRGKRCGCYCAPKACHGDPLKEWADSEPGTIQIGEGRFV